MPNHFRKLLIIQKKRCHVRKHVSGRATTYEIRFRRDGYNVSACGKTIELAKENFIKKLANAKPVEEKAQSTFPTNFQEFTLYYCEKFRKLKITEQTYKNDLSKFRLHIFPALGKKDLQLFAGVISPLPAGELLQMVFAETSESPVAADAEVIFCDEKIGVCLCQNKCHIFSKAFACSISISDIL